MILFGDIYKEVIAAMRAESNPEQQAKARRRINSDYRAIVARDSWADLRDMKTLSWAGSPIQLPSNIQGIDLVWDDLNGLEFLRRNHADIQPNTNAVLYYTYPVGTFLARVSDGAFAPGNSSFDSPNLEAEALTLVGEFFYVDSEEQLYEITEVSGSLVTFTPEYKGQTAKSAAVISVRPPYTMMLELYGPYGNQLPTAELQFFYWKQPDTLVHDEDIVHLPTQDVLALRSLGNLPEARKLRPVTKTDIKEAFKEATGLNPDRPRPRLAKGVTGRVIDFTRNYYGASSSGRGRSCALRDRWQR
jgi:hypothetical protein